MILVDCDTCKLRGRCGMFSAQHRVTVMAWARGLSAPECQEYQERTWRGIDGVIDLSIRGARRSLRPSAPRRRAPKNDIKITEQHS